MTPRLTSRQLARITQTTGARVRWQGRDATVTGHYDDDQVFIHLDGEEETLTPVWTRELELLPKQRGH